MKLTEYENILTGKKENLLDIGGLFGKVVGVVIMLFVVATGQNLAKKISSTTKLDTQLDNFVAPAPAPASANSKRIY